MVRQEWLKSLLALDEGRHFLPRLSFFTHARTRTHLDGGFKTEEPVALADACAFLWVMKLMDDVSTRCRLGRHAKRVPLERYAGSANQKMNTQAGPCGVVVHENKGEIAITSGSASPGSTEAVWYFSWKDGRKSQHDMDIWR